MCPECVYSVLVEMKIFFKKKTIELKTQLIAFFILKKVVSQI